MAKTKLKRGSNVCSKLIYDCFSRLKMRALKYNFLLYISRFIKFLNYIMIIDIIFFNIKEIL